jgi:polysaccharide deacetylase 2 family uncharacterized protein YibQ
VADDDLSAPLGRSRTGKKRRRRFSVPVTFPQAIAGALALFLLTCGGWAVMVDEPLGGEPMAVVATSLDPQQPAAAAAQGPRSYAGPTGQKKVEAAAAPPPGSPPGTRTVTIIDGSTGKRQEVAIPATRDARAPVEPRLSETSKYGALPRIAPDGARPSEVYARPLGPPHGHRDAPRIAIIVGGLGISASLTDRAIDKLPGPVTFAFPPYGGDVDRVVTRARAKGHEVLLQAAMEPFEYPDNDPGPQTLLTSLAMEQNLDRLHWQMSRFQGYVGIANYMGARFVSTEQALAPVLKETARRGLLYVDDGTAARSLAGQIAGANNLPYARAEVTLDAVPTPAAIDRALARLEAKAKEHGSAVGFAHALPASIERIAQWAKAAEGRGFVLVPITAVAIKAKSS